MHLKTFTKGNLKKSFRAEVVFNRVIGDGEKKKTEKEK